MPVASYLVEDSVGVHGSACQQRLSQFFSQWFDTAYPAGGKANRPMITGPGLAGPGFRTAGGACA